MKSSKKQQKIECAIHEEKLIMLYSNVFVRYRDGAAVLYRHLDEDPDLVEVPLFLDYVKGWDASDYWKVLKDSEIEDLEYYISDYAMMVCRNIPKKTVDVSNPVILSMNRFFAEGGWADLEAQKCLAAFSDEVENVWLYYETDFRLDTVKYYGYAAEKLPIEELGDAYYNMDIKTYEEYREEAERCIGSNSGSESEAECKSGSDAGEKDGDSGFFEAAREEMKLPPIIRSIKKWLATTKFTDFCAFITDRVKGQEDTERIAACVYTYLKNIALGRQQISAHLLAAPSGCGKTETYRALREYFSVAIPELPVSQVDITTITEEGFKGKDTNEIVRDLFSAGTNGVGIVFKYVGVRPH